MLLGIKAHQPEYILWLLLPAGVQASSASTGMSSQKVPVTAMADLDLLGQNLLQQSLGGKDQRNHFPPQQYVFFLLSHSLVKHPCWATVGGRLPLTRSHRWSLPCFRTTPKKMTMNQLAAVSAGSQSAPGTQPTLLLLANQNSSSQSTAILNPVGPGSAASQELLPLTDIFVPLENIKPGEIAIYIAKYTSENIREYPKMTTDLIYMQMCLLLVMSGSSSQQWRIW